MSTETIGQLAHTLVTTVASTNTKTLSNQLRIIIRFLDWAQQSGHELDTESLFTPDMVAFYCHTLDGRYAPNSVANVHSALETIGRTNTRTAPWAPAKRPKKPHTPLEIYSPAQITQFWELWELQPTVRQKRVLGTILVLSHGSGLRTPELMTITPAQINQHRSVNRIRVSDRIIPLNHGYDAELEWLLDHTPDDQLLIGRSHAQRDPFSKLLDTVTIPRGFHRPSVTQLRNTWIVSLLNHGMGIADVLRLAGLHSLTTIERLLPHLATTKDLSSVATIDLSTTEHIIEYR